MKKQYLKSLVFSLVTIMMGFCWPGQVAAVEPVSIAHSVQSYIENGPTTTVTLNLEVKNNSGTNMNNVVVTLTPMPKDHLFLGLEEAPSLSIGNLAAGQLVNTAYTLTGMIISPQDMIATLPIFWDVRYTDDTNNENGAMIASDGNNSGGGQ